MTGGDAAAECCPLPGEALLPPRSCPAPPRTATKNSRFAPRAAGLAAHKTSAAIDLALAGLATADQPGERTGILIDGFNNVNH